MGFHQYVRVFLSLSSVPHKRHFLFVVGQICNTFSLQNVLVRVQLHRTESTLTSFRKKAFGAHSGL